MNALGAAVVLAFKVVLAAVQARHPVRDERQHQHQLGHAEEQVVLEDELVEEPEHNLLHPRQLAEL